jgi:hypothetical protein
MILTPTSQLTMFLIISKGANIFHRNITPKRVSYRKKLKLGPDTFSNRFTPYLSAGFLARIHTEVIMKKLLTISYTLIAVLFIGMAADKASAQTAENPSKSSTGGVVARRGSSVDLGSLAFNGDASIFNFTSTELRQISGRYAAEGSNAHSAAVHEYWDKLNSRIEFQRVRLQNR